MERGETPMASSLNNEIWLQVIVDESLKNGQVKSIKLNFGS